MGLPGASTRKGGEKEGRRRRRVTKRKVHPALSPVTSATGLLFANSRYSPLSPPKLRAETWVGPVLEPPAATKGRCGWGWRVDLSPARTNCLHPGYQCQMLCAQTDPRPQNPSEYIGSWRAGCGKNPDPSIPTASALPSCARVPAGAKYPRPVGQGACGFVSVQLGLMVDVCEPGDLSRCVCQFVYLGWSILCAVMRPRGL